MTSKDIKYWAIIYRESTSHKLVGPIWSLESKIKPTKWAKERCYDGCDYAIKEEVEERDGIPESELQGLTWYTKEG